eukprot:scaffold17582_cov72-Cyclotella_meneghiniana.AAC.4
MFGFCQYPIGDDILIDGGCTGDSACTDLASNYVRIQTGACHGTYACQSITSENISIGEGSCNSVRACVEMAGIILAHVIMPQVSQGLDLGAATALVHAKKVLETLLFSPQAVRVSRGVPGADRAYLAP